MLEQLLAWDKFIFSFLNSFHSEFFDNFFWIVTQKETWIPLYIAILYIIIRTKRKEATWIILGLIVTIVLADQLSSSLIKPLVERLRPSRDSTLSGLIHLVNGYTGGKYGFVSSHAANSFALALYSSLLFRNKPYTIFIFIWALINAYSRIYIGVHFPLDIIGGAAIGFISVGIVYCLLNKYQPVIFKPNKYKPKSKRRFWNTEKLILLVIELSFLVIFGVAFAKITIL